jgi:hypothetical protein
MNIANEKVKCALSLQCLKKTAYLKFTVIIFPKFSRCTFNNHLTKTK